MFCWRGGCTCQLPCFVAADLKPFWRWLLVTAIPINVSFFFIYDALQCFWFVFFVAVSQDKESEEETTSVESDDNSSDYFADTETSSCEEDDVFTSNSEGKDATDKGLTTKLFICLMVVFHQSLITSFGLHHCWSSSGDGWDSGNIPLVGQNEFNLV